MRKFYQKSRFRFVGSFAFGALLLAAYIYREWVHEALLKPLFYVWLFLKIYLESLPGLLLWFVFLVLAIVALGITLLNLFKQKIVFDRSEDKYAKEPLKALAQKIEMATRGNLFRWSLNREISEIVITLIMARERVDLWEARRRFNSGTWTSDEEIKKLLTLEMPPNFSSWLTRFSPKGYLKLVTPSTQVDLKKIVAYLEEFSRPGGNRATR